MKHVRWSVAVAGVLGVTVAVLNLSAAAASVHGTVTATGLSSNADAVVYIQEAAAGKASAPVVMDQVKFQFLPHVLPVVLGTTVQFHNGDPTPHNVFSPDYEKYNLGTWPSGQSKDYTFAKCAKFPCVYTQLCRVHPEMEGFVVVLQNAHFAVSDRTGHYEIADVPPGQYTLAVWHPKLKAQSKSITVDAKGATADFTLTK